MRRILVAGNWKMNGASAANGELVAGIIEGASRAQNVDLLVCPPFPYLAAVARQLADSAIALGAQTVSEHQSGAYTGEVAPAMLRDVGCEYVIVGHSERRALYGESNEAVARKFAAAIAAGLRPILCVGETLEQREQGNTESIVSAQLEAVLDVSGIHGFETAVVAYEPVWAIGTGLTATPEQAQEVHRHIRELLSGHDAAVAGELLILYGGSVKGENAAGLFAMPDIDGGLIGGASLKARDFLAIAEAATQI